MLDYHDFHAYSQLKHEYILEKLGEYRQEGLRKLSCVLAQAETCIDIITVAEDWLDDQHYAKKIVDLAGLDRIEMTSFLGDVEKFESIMRE